MKTYFPKEGEIKQSWYIVDAEGEVLGRLAARLAAILRGKTKPTYTPYADTGDFVVVVNAEKVLLTGNKIDKKRYYRHSKHPGGLKVTTARTMLDKKPETVVMLAVRGMLPKNSLGRKMLKKLKVYKGKDHPHKAQMPVELNIKEAYSA